MSLLASQLAEDAATAIEHQDPLSSCRLAVADDAVDALLRHLFAILFAEDWSHRGGTGGGRRPDRPHYERFGAHAVAIAQRFCSVVTERIPEPTALETTCGPSPCSP